MDIIHKAMTLKQLRSLGYNGFYERALCENGHLIIGNMLEPYEEGYSWKRVNCKACLKKKKGKAHVQSYKSRRQR